MTLRNNLYFLSLCIFSLNCLGASHDESPFANGNAGWAPGYDSNEAHGTVALVYTYHMDPIDSFSDCDEQNNGNAGWTIEHEYPQDQPMTTAYSNTHPPEGMDLEADDEEENDNDNNMDEENCWTTPI